MAEIVGTNPQPKRQDEHKDAPAKDFAGMYKKFATLKHLQFNGNTGKYESKLLKEQPLREFEKLEKEIKSWKGARPKKTVTVYVPEMAKNVKLVAGYAIPESLEKELKNTKMYNSYF